MSTEIKTQEEKISTFLNNEVVQSKIQEMFKNQDKVNHFVTSVISLVGSTTQLADVDRNSLLTACLSASSLNLPVNQNLGFAYIVPYKQKYKEGGIWKTKKVAQLQVGYKGFIQLAQRSDLFKTIDAKPIYEGQLIEDSGFSGINFDWSNKKSDKVIGYASYFALLNGFEKVLYMSVEELKGHGLKYSYSYQKEGKGLWVDDFEAMARKTVLKLLLSRYAPLSTELQKAVEFDQSSSEGYVDNQKISLEENNSSKELERVVSWIESSTTLEELSTVNDYIYQSGDTDLVDLYESKLDGFSK